VVDVLLDAGEAEGLAGPGEHAGALRNQVFDAGTRGGGVIEDLGREIVCGERGGHSLEALAGCRVGERRRPNRGGHTVLLSFLLTGWCVSLSGSTAQPCGM